MKRLIYLERGDKVSDIEMVSPCFKTDTHDCTVTGIDYMVKGKMVTFTCDMCLRVKRYTE